MKLLKTILAIDPKLLSSKVLKTLIFLFFIIFLNFILQQPLLLLVNNGAVNFEPPV